MKTFLKFLPYILTFAITLIFAKKCMSPRIETVTTVISEEVIDSIKGTVDIPEPIIDTVTKDSIIYRQLPSITLKGKDTIIYKTDTIFQDVKVNRYDTKLETNNAIANLSIYTTGTLFKVDGTISYQKETKTVKTTQFLNENATYLYLETSLMPLAKKFQVGVDRTINNKLLFGASVEYIPEYKLGFLNARVGINISRKK
jgi:hypothetical protein